MVKPGETQDSRGGCGGCGGCGGGIHQAHVAKLCQIWRTKPNVTKFTLSRVDDWTNDSYAEDCFIEIRAYGKAERTQEMVLDGMNKVQTTFLDEGLVANIQLTQ
eukprot:scaffold116767_cov57-Attheya_sp.AAC.5